MKLVAPLLAAALVITSPGLASYEAAAQVIGVSVPVESIGPAMPAASPAAALSAAPTFGLRSVSLIGVLPGAGRITMHPEAKAAAAVVPQALPVPVVLSVPGPMPVQELLEQKETLALPAADAERMPAAQARDAGFSIMDKILGVRARRVAAEEAVAPAEPGAAAAVLPRSTPPAFLRPKTPPPPSLSPLASMADRMKDRVFKLFRVLPDAERNRQFWIYTLGQALLNLGVSFHSTALPQLVSPAKEDAGKLGVNRAVNWSAQAAASFSTGPLVDNASNGNKVFVRTFLGRSVLLLGVSALFFPGFLSSGVFLAIIFATSYLQAMGLNAGSVAFTRLLGDDEANYDKANAVFNIVQEVSSIVGFLVAGAFIGMADQVLRHALAGNALSYAVYALLAALVALMYRRWLRVPRDELLQARSDLSKKLIKKRKWAWLLAAAAILSFGRVRDERGRVAAVSASRHHGQPALLVEVNDDPAMAQGLPSEFEGYPVQVVARRSQSRDLVEGFKVIWKDRFLRLSLLFPTLYLIVSDALTFAALPRYIGDILGTVSTTVPGLARIPLVGPALSGLTSTAGAFGLYMAAGSLGMLISSLLLMRFAKLSSQRAGPSELTSREKQGRWSSIMEGLSMFAYAAVFLGSTFLGTGLWFSVGAMLLAEMLQAPATIIWASLDQKVISAQYPESMGKIYSAIYFYQLLCSLFGVLFFGWLIAAVSTSVALLVVGVILAVAGILFIVQPFATFPLKR